jgi:hypothetical protein
VMLSRCFLWGRSKFYPANLGVVHVFDVFKAGKIGDLKAFSLALGYCRDALRCRSMRREGIAQRVTELLSSFAPRDLLNTIMENTCKESRAAYSRLAARYYCDR